MWKFPSQKLNSCHSSNQSRCRDNARSLIHYVTREIPVHNFPKRYLDRHYFTHFPRIIPETEDR